ncbi:MAG TPA: alpha/beta hydrolase [Planctomycetaceae bacterium]|nr:alpha/beta hydrolase [Planctomycetaceae bacterium]
MVTAAILISTLTSNSEAQTATLDVPYIAAGHARQKLDIYTPSEEQAKPDAGWPVMFWIHGGGWQTGDKSNVHLKPKVLCGRGMVFVSTNYRLLPEVTMQQLTSDVAQSLAWTQKHISAYGGDPSRIVVAGHSAGAQLAALMCIDHSWIRTAGGTAKSFIGCVPVDGDTYDIPKIIATAELRAALYGFGQPTFGHRQKFGNDPRLHTRFSAVNHIETNKAMIPPFLTLYFSGNPETLAQARRLDEALKAAGVSSQRFGKAATNHRQLNADLGNQDDEVTERFFAFLDRVLAAEKSR